MTLTPPMITVEIAPTADVPVIVDAMFLKRRSTPPLNTASSRFSATYVLTRRIPPSVSLRRPVTSALISWRLRKIGRSFLNAMDIDTAKMKSSATVASVSRAFSASSTTKAATAVTFPPINWTSPVPTRFRIPSGSVMIREIRTPLLVESK